MRAEKLWSHFFKPEVRKQGSAYFDSGAVVLQIAADTRVQAFIKGAARIKVSLVADSIASPSFDANCTCPSSQRGQLCKHIWAILLAVDSRSLDFLDSKTEIAKGTSSQVTSQPARPESASLRARKDTLKTKQAEYRKAQYQKQKQKMKDRKSGMIAREPTSAHPDLPDDVADALRFFLDNGFAFANPITSIEVINARKVLSRIFHPDKGGTHEEALLLNSNYEILMMWAGE
jgi:uncharacterized Zn finger protein